MSNAPDTKISRHEAIGFAAAGQVLGVAIYLADNNGQNSFPDGKWEAQGQVGFIEVTALPDKGHMAQWAKLNRKGEQYLESGSAPVNYGELHLWVQELLAQDWAKENIRKLNNQKADVRHLYLHAHSTHNREMLSRLSETFQNASREPVGLLELPEGIESVWFEGRSFRSPDKPEEFRLNLARFDAESGWRRYVLVLEEAELPPAEPLPGQ